LPPLLALGGVLHAAGDAKEGRRQLEQALALAEKAYGPDHATTVACHSMLGGVLHDLKDYGAARPHLERAVRFYREQNGPDHLFTTSSQMALGMTLAATGDDKGAWEHLGAGITALARQTTLALAGSAEAEHPALILFWRHRFETLLSLAEQTNRASPDLMTVIFNWKAVGTRALALRQEALILGRDAEAWRLYGELKAVRRQVADRQMHSRQEDEAGRAALRRLRAQQADLERELAGRMKEFAALRQAEQSTPETVARRLGEDGVLMEIVRYRGYDFRAGGREKPWQAARYAAVLLIPAEKADTPPTVRLVRLGEAGAIDRAIRVWRASAESGEAAPAADAELRRLVWEPVAGALPERTRRLFIAPDGELSLLPFEAIRLADGRYLVEQFRVSYLSSGRDLVPRPGALEEPGPAVVFGDPDYDAVQEGPVPARELSAPEERRSGDLVKDLRFRRLTGFGLEADAVAGAWRQTRLGEPLAVLRGPDASEERLATLRRPRLLHLITHGFFLPDLGPPKGLPDRRGFEVVPLGGGRPALPDFGEDLQLRSGLALAGANRWQQRVKQGRSDGLLTALEAKNLDLWGTELVVLSACETGLGQVSPVGEGVLGLRRAFQAAGARTVLASLWRVPDAHTSRLMTRFYESWLSGKGKAEALREAQLKLIAELRKEEDPRRKSAPPLYWAGFICHGLPQ
jgi:CHAT domain-containing protein